VPAHGKAVPPIADLLDIHDRVQWELRSARVRLESALAKARESDVAEIEPLRDVAWNDVVVEIGRPEVRVALRPTQRLLAALA